VSSLNAVPNPGLDTPVRFDPSPKNSVALTIPATSNFASGDVELIPTLREESILIAWLFANLDKSLALDIRTLF